jgi:hypothetical protein
MAVNDRLKRYLDQERAPYETLPHREAFTARQELLQPPLVLAELPLGDLYSLTNVHSTASRRDGATAGGSAFQMLEELDLAQPPVRLGSRVVSAESPPRRLRNHHVSAVDFLDHP